jgi:hypothetical protein
VGGLAIVDWRKLTLAGNEPVLFRNWLMAREEVASYQDSDPCFYPSFSRTEARSINNLTTNCVMDSTAYVVDVLRAPLVGSMVDGSFVPRA